MWTGVPFIQEVSCVYTSPFLDADELKMALRVRNVSGAFEERAPGHYLTITKAIELIHANTRPLGWIFLETYTN